MEPIKSKQHDIRVVPRDGLKWRVEYRKWEHDLLPREWSHDLEESEIDAKLAEFREMVAARDRQQRELGREIYDGVPNKDVPNEFKSEWARANMTVVKPPEDPSEA